MKAAITDYRRKLWLNIMEDLGPPAGCIVPLWLRCVYTAIFPVHGLRCLLDSACGFDYLRMTWKIHGVEFHDLSFVRLALAKGGLYRFNVVNGVAMVERVELPKPSISDREGYLPLPSHRIPAAFPFRDSGGIL
jgi:hypothetical protein